MEAIGKTAVAVGAQLSWLTPDPAYRAIPMTMEGVHQKENAQLAAQLVTTWIRDAPPARTFNQALLDRVDPDTGLPQYVVSSVTRTQWPGRSQIIRDDAHNLKWFIDGAHTRESIEACCRWYEGCVEQPAGEDHQPRPALVLLFNCTGGRAGEAMLAQLAQFFIDRKVLVAHAVFCPNITNRPDSQKPDQQQLLSLLSDQRAHERVWRTLVPADSNSSGAVEVVGSIGEAVDWIQNHCNGAHVLVTGSLHLAGGVLDALDIAPFGNTD
ncbi:Mur ligase [Dimargaris cristalligena]|uniref:Mur ligase n=1 Tax=Dimargaris cristalligena TaxID=215637 RepID=A0A4P9ZJN0_9FUNG|nr:Mur ligase [Dimargaris cristalligena]|eukprot:RKP33466.1 Mur ligase [Dimargaris cristalligena]